MIQFILNNEVVKTSENNGMTLLDFIRENKSLKGTKIGCREGDCGACTVLVGVLNGEKVTYQSITSCISPLGNANGKHVVTVEGINLQGKLNFVQEAMSNNFATQCGFCTPGFVVSMTGYALENNKVLNSCNDAISGNICRCTGYKSIEKAGLEIEKKLENKNHQIKWLIDEGFVPNYFATIPEKLKEISNVSSSEINKSQSGTVVANGTDLYVRYADKLSEEKVHLIANDTSLKGINLSDDTFTIGVNTTVTEILENDLLRENIPNLKSFIKLVSSEQIRNMGTIGGNFVNASPIGDMSIFFLAMNSTLTIRDENGSERSIPFQEFHQDYKKYDLKEGEILKSISFRMLKKGDYFNFEKVSKRTHLDIASVNLAGRISIKEGVVFDAHFSVGGVAAVPKYLSKTNEFLKGEMIVSETIHMAEKIMQSEISPISDVRGTSDYKRLLARQLFFAHFTTLFPNDVELNRMIEV